MRILICGKGGSGKSVLTALLTNCFTQKGFNVFVIDADGSNLGLALMLGVKHPKNTLLDCLGGRENILLKISKNFEKQFLSGKPDFGSLGFVPLNMVTSSNGRITFLQLDKVLVGGEGCFCPAQIILEGFLSGLPKNKDNIVLVDMGAGVEFLGRSLSKGLVDLVLAVVDPTWDSIELTVRIQRMFKELGYNNFFAVLNKIQNLNMEDLLTSELEKRKVNVLGSVRYDPVIQISTLEGFTLKSSLAKEDINNICKKLLMEDPTLEVKVRR